MPDTKCKCCIEGKECAWQDCCEDGNCCTSEGCKCCPTPTNRKCEDCCPDCQCAPSCCDCCCKR